MGDRLRRFAMREEILNLARRVSSVVQAQSAYNVAEAALVDTPHCIRVGVGTTGLIVLGGTQDISVTWSTPMPRDTYQLDASGLTGILGRGTTAVLSHNAAGCMVRVTATLAISAGANFVVMASCPNW